MMAKLLMASEGLSLARILSDMSKDYPEQTLALNYWKVTLSNWLASEGVSRSQMDSILSLLIRIGMLVRQPKGLYKFKKMTSEEIMSNLDISEEDTMWLMKKYKFIPGYPPRPKTSSNHPVQVLLSVSDQMEERVNKELNGEYEIWFANRNYALDLGVGIPDGSNTWPKMGQIRSYLGYENMYGRKILEGYQIVSIKISQQLQEDIPKVDETLLDILLQMGFRKDSHLEESSTYAALWDHGTLRPLMKIESAQGSIGRALYDFLHAHELEEKPFEAWMDLAGPTLSKNFKNVLRDCLEEYDDGSYGIQAVLTSPQAFFDWVSEETQNGTTLTLLLNIPMPSVPKTSSMMDDLEDSLSWVEESDFEMGSPGEIQAHLSQIYAHPHRALTILIQEGVLVEEIQPGITFTVAEDWKEKLLSLSDADILFLHNDRKSKTL